MASGTDRAPTPTLADPRRFLILANPMSGRRGEARSLVERANRELEDVATTFLDPDVDLAAVVSTAVADGRILVAAGGDGTVNAVAHHLVGTPGVLGILPAGMLNHFARDLGLADTAVAFHTLARGRPAAVDAGLAGGHHFLNTVVVGLYPEAVQERRRAQQRIGKWPALAVGWLKVLLKARPLAGSIVADGDGRALLAWTVVAANNRFSTTPGRIGERDRLDEGVLDLHVVPGKRGVRGRYSLAKRTLRPRPWGWGRHVRRVATAVRLELEEPRPFTTDGELREPVDGLDVAILPRSLHVLVPASGNWTSAEATE